LIPLANSYDKDIYAANGIYGNGDSGQQTESTSLDADEHGVITAANIEVLDDGYVVSMCTFVLAPQKITLIRCSHLGICLILTATKTFPAAC
jgi:hypothetical protein